MIEQHTPDIIFQKQKYVKIDGTTFPDQPINDIKTYEKIKKIATGQGYDYTTGRLLDYHYFRENYKMIATGLTKQPALATDPREIQQISFTGNLDHPGNMFFIFDEAKETVFDFSQGTVRVLYNNLILSNISL